MKRGISPLIATILLIGFGITLAVFVMNWGTDFLKSSQKDVEEQSREKFGCTTDVAFEIKCDCDESGGNVESCQFKVVNNEDSKINKISYRFFRGDSFLLSGEETITGGLDAWEVSSYYDVSGFLGIEANNINVEVLANEVETGGKIVNCGGIASNIANCIIN